MNSRDQLLLRLIYEASVLIDAQECPCLQCQVVVTKVGGNLPGLLIKWLNSSGLEGVHLADEHRLPGVQPCVERLAASLLTIIRTELTIDAVIERVRGETQSTIDDIRAVGHRGDPLRN